MGVSPRTIRYREQGKRPQGHATYMVSSAMKDFFETKSFLECLTPFNKPADTLVGVASLAGSEEGQLIEMDAIAVID